MSIVATKASQTEALLSYLQDKIKTFPGVPDLRATALERFSTLGIPTNKHEEFRKTPISKVLEGYSLESKENQEVNPTEFLIPSLDGYTMVFVDGKFKPKYSTIPEDKIIALPMEVAIESHRELIAKHLGKHADFTKDGLVAWNTAAWTSGAFVYIPQNIVLDKPIIISNIITNTAQQVSRNLIVVEKSSEVTFIEKTTSTKGGFLNSVTEGFVEENAVLNYYMLQNNDAQHTEFNHKQLVQKNSSQVNAFTFTLGGKLIRNNLNLILDGSNCDSHMNGVYLLKGDSICDNHTIADHKQPHSQSNELYKGALEGKSKGIFNGRIYVRPQAQKTNAFQSNRNILLSEDATIHTKPQLEIWADDVKCSHGCTTGQLDEEALFYLQTRGLSKDTARAMLLYAFVGEVIDRIKIPALRSYIDQLVSDRLHTNF